MTYDELNGDATTDIGFPHSDAGYSSPVDGPTKVELFTHPICNGCQEALGALSKLEREGAISLTVSSLSTANGRLRAAELGVTTVPTARFREHYRVLMHKSDLADLIKELVGQQLPPH